MDKLDHIFELQKAFDEDLCRRRNLQDIDQATWMQKEVLAIISELGELLNEVNFKWWKNPKPINQGKIKEELVDILHFFISMCNKMGISSQELYEAYQLKNKENFARQNGSSAKQGYEIIP
ncbi:MAG: dUTPase [Syntrophomonadaceae bacterium]|jgi:dimeric dUTPase (all-alpha-NTP-PPase superfamily)|nr:dUTPase [Syntrophomonadaceae bacterium]